MIARIRVIDPDAKPLPRIKVPDDAGRAPLLRVRVPTMRPTSRRLVKIDRALTDPNLLGAALGDPESWTIWRAVLRAAFGLPLQGDDLEHFQAVAGDRAPPDERVDELWAVVGRRSGKTRIAAAISVHIATLEEHHLAAGEIGYVMLLAASRSQAQVAFQYVVGFLEASPILRQQIESVTADEVRLAGNIIIGVATNSYRTIRGKSLLAVVGDETSFWRSEESAAPDVETYRACVPALAATGGMFIGISTGYRKLGLLYSKYRDHFGQPGNEVLVIQGSTATLNPTFNRAKIAKAIAADPEAGESEWQGGFRNDIAAFLDDATIDAAINLSRPIELPPRDGFNYQAFTDVSGGRHDAYTLAIGHKEGEQFVADVIRGKKAPFDPQSVTADYAKLLKDYKITKCVGDNYSANWCETAWKGEGIAYERSELPKSALYLEALPLFTRGLASIPDHASLSRELRLLERRTSRTGKDIVDHGRNGTDDYANALAGLLYLLSKKSKYNYRSDLEWVDGGKDDEPGDWTMQNLIQRMQTPSMFGGNRGRRY